MLSSATKRSTVNGFTLLEAILGFAILGIILTMTYSLSAGALQRQVKELDRYKATAFARATLDEYIVTYPLMDVSGVFRNHWDWEVVEATHPPLYPTELDKSFQFIEITVRVGLISDDTPEATLSTVVVRAAQSQ